MNTLDLRPLSLGELLDRTFLLYRRHFFLFTGIAAIPYSALLVVSLANVLLSTRLFLPEFPLGPAPVQPSAIVPSMIEGGVAVFLVSIVAFLYSVGASVSAISEIYLGRSTSIVASLKNASGRFFALLGVAFLTLLIAIGGLMLLVIPAFYLMCRVSVAIAASVLEKTGPISAIRRSFQLTKGFAGRAFMIFTLYFVLALAVGGALQFPFGVLLVVYAKQSSAVTLIVIMMQVSNFFVRVLVAPIGTISAALYYYDLRVRKEAFDLQMIMQAIGGDSLPPPQITGGVPSMFGRDVS